MYCQMCFANICRLFNKSDASIKKLRLHSTDSSKITAATDLHVSR